MVVVKKGDTIQVEYVGKLEDGTVFDSSQQHQRPLEFCVGSGQIIKGFDDAVVGMRQDEEKEVIIPPQDGYGAHHADLIREIPRSFFPADREVRPGMVFIMALDSGKKTPVRITHVTSEFVIVDMNPPLAGKTLIFIIKLLAIVS
jgi:FKBP-type peptidyl-prolyl cis-trans isomerase 2